MEPPIQADPVLALQSQVGEEWPAITRAIAEAIETRSKVEKIALGLTTTDASMCVFGSLARKEWTAKSDVDWTLLVDGQADPQHLELAQQIALQLQKDGFGEPGRTGLFGSMTFSHDLVQKIGGGTDTNENTTRRVLLLQESLAFGQTQAHERVLKLILSRYLKDDSGLRYGSQPYKVPRFLLNDIVRYWRTVTVDFVEKQRREAGDGWGLRNAKLRLSRKLIFAAGMLSCFSCDLLASAEAREELKTIHSTVRMEEHLLSFMKMTPLEILATFLIERKLKKETAHKLFSSYNAFLVVLNDPEKRGHLKGLRPEDVKGDTVFDEVRRFSHEFQDGLTAMFFKDDEKLRDLTIFYGVF
jgi:predicted nucleotidyltransferase